MTAYEIPLSGVPEKFSIALAGTTYQFAVNWNDVGQFWAIDIADKDGNPLLSGVPLVTGCNLLEQYDYLNFGGQLIVQTDHDVNAVPTYDNLGTNSHLYFVTP